ncbi:hypothetical protein Tco_0956779 [Tanacetum coccineum]
MFTTIHVISRNEDTTVVRGLFLLSSINQRGHSATLNHTKEYHYAEDLQLVSKEKKGKNLTKSGKGYSRRSYKQLGDQSLSLMKETGVSLRGFPIALIMTQMMIYLKSRWKMIKIINTSSVSSSMLEDSDNEVEGMDVEGEKSDEDATYVEDQGNEVDRDTNANLEGRDDVKTDLFYIIWLRLQHAKSDAIFRHNAQATSLIDIPVTAIAEPSFFAPTNHPPTPTPLFIQLQQSPILTPTTTPSSSLQNLPDFASLFGFDNRLKALGDNFSEFKQTNQYAEALSSILGIVDQYLANKLKEAVDVVVQLKSDRI